MSGRSMNLDVLVRLRDRLSGPMRRLKNNLKSLANVGRQIGVIGVAIAAISFLAPIREAAAFQQKLLDIAGTQNLVGDAAFAFAKKTGEQYQTLALRIGQTSDTIAEGAGQMVAAGGKSAEVVDQVIGTVGKAATAANAQFSDMAGVATSLINTLDVPETGLEGALAGLVVAGKEGAFELKDMARYFPQLTSQMAKFGIKGREASDQIATLLQISKKGAADPGQAANNLNNFLSKALAPATMKNFKKMGVDIEAVMKDAAAKGINPLEAMLQKVGKLTGVSSKAISKYMGIAEKRGLKGAEALGFVREQLEAIGAAGKLGGLFQDQQVLDFLVPFLANIEEYKRIKAQVAAATGSTIDKDFETQMAGLNRQLTMLGEIGTQAVRKVGFAFGAWLPMINATLMSMLGFVNRLDESTGGWVTSAITAAGGGILFAGALGAIGLAMPIVIAGFSALASVAAIALGPIGLLVAAIGGGALYIGKNWDRYGPRLMRLWDRTKRGFFDFATGLADRGRDIVRGGRELVDRYGPAVRDGVGRAWAVVSRIASAAAARMPSFDTIKTAGLDALRVSLDALSRLKTGALDWLATLKLPRFGEIKTAGLDALVNAIERLKAVGQFALTFFGNFTAGFAAGFGASDFSSAGAAASALNLLSAAFERIKAIGQGAVERLQTMLDVVGRLFTGFGSQASEMGKGLGDAVGQIGALITNVGGLFTDLMALGDRISGSVGIDWKKVLGDGAEGLGSLFGQGVTQIADNLGTVVRVINEVVSAIRLAITDWDAFVTKITTAIGIPEIDWTPVSATFEAVKSVIIAGIELIISTIGKIAGAASAAAKAISSIGPAGGPVGGVGAFGATEAGRGSQLGNNPLKPIMPGDVPAPANSNAPGKQSSLVSPTKLAALAPAKSEVSGTIRIAVDGPGKVTEAKSSNSRVALAPDRGRAVGRA